MVWPPAPAHGSPARAHNTGAPPQSRPAHAADSPARYAAARRARRRGGVAQVRLHWFPL
jgi:hypothetical protein